jgi:hypothetical protein
VRTPNLTRYQGHLTPTLSPSEGERESGAVSIWIERTRSAVLAYEAGAELCKRSEFCWPTTTPWSARD